MATIKAVYKYADEINRKKFCTSQCLLTISAGQEAHENEKFETTVELVNNSFKSCIILIDDSLQRHTMALDRTENADDMYQIAVDEGDRWLIRNEKYFSKLSNLNTIIRWSQWLNHSNYNTNYNIIKQTMACDATYNKAFDDTIKEFLQRYCKRLTHENAFDIDRAYNLCLEYLLEECTAMTLWPELACQFEVYPSKRNLAMHETHKRFVLPKWPDLLHSVAIKFKNRGQLKPQTFDALP